MTREGLLVVQVGRVYHRPRKYRMVYKKMSLSYYYSTTSPILIIIILCYLERRIFINSQSRFVVYTQASIGFISHTVVSLRETKFKIRLVRRYPTARTKQY